MTQETKRMSGDISGTMCFLIINGICRTPHGMVRIILPKIKKKGSNRKWFLVGSDKDSIEGTVHLANGERYAGLPTSLTFPTLSEHGYGYTEDQNGTAYKGAA